MFAMLHGLGTLLVDLFKSRSRLEAENLFLRHQLNIAMRRAPPRLRLHGSDRAFLVWMIRLWPSLIDTVQVVQPETVLRWHRAGFQSLLALEIEEKGRAAEDRPGTARSDSADEQRKSVVGCLSDPR